MASTVFKYFGFLETVSFIGPWEGLVKRYLTTGRSVITSVKTKRSDLESQSYDINAIIYNVHVPRNLHFAVILLQQPKSKNERAAAAVTRACPKILRAHTYSASASACSTTTLCYCTVPARYMHDMYM